MRQVSTQILSGATDGSITGSAQPTQQWVSASFQIGCNGLDEAGTVKLQGCNDNGVASNWSDIPNATSAVSSGVGPMILLANMAFCYVRAVYTRSGGGASNKTLTVQANGLSI